MAAKDTFCKQTLITKTEWTCCIVWRSDGVWGASKGETRESRGRKRQEKNLSVVQAGFNARVAWLGHLFQGFPATTKSRKKRKKHFLQGPPHFPLPNLSTTRPSCAQHLATACLFRLLGTNIKFKDGATEVPSRMFLYFPTSRFVAIILHALRGNYFIQESFVTFFVSFLTDVLRGSCFLPQQYSPARINVFARVPSTCYTYGALQHIV